MPRRSASSPKDVLGAEEVGRFLESYMKYPPIGRKYPGDPHCINCGKVTLNVDDEIDMVAYHVFRCKSCEKKRRKRFQSE